MLTRLGQKGTGSGPEAPNSSGAADAPPAERRDLPHTVTAAERGKPVVSPAPKRGKRLAREADGAAGSGGGSKRTPVGNGPDRGCASSATSPRGESRLTSLWSFVTREPWPTD